MPEAEARDWQTKQARFEFKRDPSNGYLIGPDGCHYETEAEAMYFAMTGGCGCGCPDDVHKFLIACLRAFEKDGPGRPRIEGVTELVSAQPEVAAEFIVHVLTDDHLLEHGSSVYTSWLTERGKQFIEVGPMKDGE